MITVVEIRRDLTKSDQIAIARVIVALINLLGLKETVRRMLI